MPRRSTFSTQTASCDLRYDLRMKRCAKCGEEKPESLYYNDSRKKDGLAASCKACHKERVYRWREANREKWNAYVAERAKDRPRRGDPAKAKARALKKKYNLTPEEHEALSARFQGRCWICKEEKPLHVDHCHATGRVRGMLCVRCNTAFEWSLKHSEQARIYATEVHVINPERIL